MADDDFDYGPARDINTDTGWLRDSNGKPVMGQGVEADLQGMQGFSKNADEVQQNFQNLARGLTGPMLETVTGAFASNGNMFPWSQIMARLATHNVQKFQEFNASIALGTANVASAAQVVANVYRDTDAGSAANLNAIQFAFGDKSKAPGSVPRQILDQLQTWDEVQRSNPVAAAAAGAPMPEDGVKVTETNGNTTTETVRLPNGNVMTTTTQPWTTYPGGPSGETRTVSYNGHVQSVTSITTVAGTTTTRVTNSYYDAKGRHQHDRVASETRTTWTVEGSGPTTTLREDTQTTSYEYNSDGEQTDSTTTNSSNAVGAERATEPMRDPLEDPAVVEQRRILGTP